MSLEEVVKPGPTATSTSDQDDNERLVRYLQCQQGSKEERLDDFVNMVMNLIKKGCSEAVIEAETTLTAFTTTRL
jgi:hypothetical protein